MIPFSFRGGSEPVGTGDSVSLIQLAHSNACVHSMYTHTHTHTHTHTAHTICGVLRFNNLLPKAYLQHKHTSISIFSHTLIPLYSAGKMRYSALTNTHTQSKKKQQEMPQSNSYPFLCENCPRSVGSCIKVTRRDDTHADTHTHKSHAQVTLMYTQSGSVT